MKNFIISILLMYIFSGIPGWACTGIEKNVICFILTILLSLIFYEIENIFKNIKRGLQK